MELEYQLVEGSLDDSYERIVDQLTVELSENDHIYIGITGRDPETRKREHESRGYDWDRMLVVYETASREEIRDLEWVLTKLVQTEIQSDAPGGMGPLSYKRGKYSLYFLLRRNAVEKMVSAKIIGGILFFPIGPFGILLGGKLGGVVADKVRTRKDLARTRMLRRRKKLKEKRRKRTNFKPGSAHKITDYK